MKNWLNADDYEGEEKELTSFLRVLILFIFVLFLIALL